MLDCWCDGTGHAISGRSGSEADKGDVFFARFQWESSSAETGAAATLEVSRCLMQAEDRHDFICPKSSRSLHQSQ
jgi:hypothetical protein